jgi:hypothetical protein
MKIGLSFTAKQKDNPMSNLIIIKHDFKESNDFDTYIKSLSGINNQLKKACKASSIDAGALIVERVRNGSVIHDIGLAATGFLATPNSVRDAMITSMTTFLTDCILTWTVKAHRPSYETKKSDLKDGLSIASYVHQNQGSGLIIQGNNNTINFHCDSSTAEVMKEVIGYRLEQMDQDKPVSFESSTMFFKLLDTGILPGEKDTAFIESVYAFPLDVTFANPALTFKAKEHYRQYGNDMGLIVDGLLYVKADHQPHHYLITHIHSSQSRCDNID